MKRREELPQRYDHTTKTASEVLRRATLKYEKQTPLENYESSDCVVRGLVACTGVDYETMHAYCAVFGRKNNTGMSMLHAMTMLDTLAFEDVSHRFTCERKHTSYGVKLVTALPSLRALGNCVVIVPGHFVCVKNGRIIDSFVNNDARILRVFRLKSGE